MSRVVWINVVVKKEGDHMKTKKTVLCAMGLIIFAVTICEIGYAGPRIRAPENNNLVRLLVPTFEHLSLSDHLCAGWDEEDPCAIVELGWNDEGYLSLWTMSDVSGPNKHWRLKPGEVASVRVGQQSKDYYIRYEGNHEMANFSILSIGRVATGTPSIGTMEKKKSLPDMAEPKVEVRVREFDSYLFDVKEPVEGSGHYKNSGFLVCRVVWNLDEAYVELIVNPTWDGKHSCDPYTLGDSINFGTRDGSVRHRVRVVGISRSFATIEIERLQ